MRLNLKPLAAALIAGGMVASAAAQALPELRFSGFGTLGVAHSDERNADFVPTVFRPNGVGGTRSTSINTDTRLGGQVDAVFNDRWSAVVQLVAQHRYDNTFTPDVEWANVKFQITPELSARLGRIASPTFLVSESRFVGYAQPWIRPPIEVYGVVPITSNDGVDLSWRKQFGAATNTVQAFYGRSKARLETGGARSSPSWGINNSVQYGDLTLRAAYSSNHVDLEFQGVNTLLGGLAAFEAVPGPIGAQAAALGRKYALQDNRLGAFSLAAQYDPGKWFVLSELVEFRGDGILADSRSWYVTGGYRLGAFTPYLTYASTRSRVANEAGIPLPAAAPINAGLNALLANQFNGTQSTASAGLRWDFVKNTALKLQYDRIDLGAGSAGRLTDIRPGFNRGGTINMFSAALDFVF